MYDFVAAVLGFGSPATRANDPSLRRVSFMRWIGAGAATLLLLLSSKAPRT